MSIKSKCTLCHCELICYKIVVKFIKLQDFSCIYEEITIYLIYYLIAEKISLIYTITVTFNYYYFTKDKKFLLLKLTTILFK